jgi:hypothetical protein
MSINCTYNDKVGFIPLPSPDPVSTGINVAQLVIEAGIAVAPFVSRWVSNAFAHPAADAKDFIKNAKPTIINLSPDDRIIKVIAYSSKINERALDVNTREWLRWYRENYRDDFLTAKPDVKIYWNKYLDNIRNSTPDHNNIYSDLDAARFSQNEININATPIETATNLVTNITSNPNVKYILYGGIGLLFVYLLSSKK